jgi:hypothetical protein
MIEDIIKEALAETVPVTELTLDVILETEKKIKNNILKKYERGIQ